MAPVRFAVIGCGDIARRGFLPAALAGDAAEVVVVASRSLDKARTFATQFGGDAVEGYDRALERSDVDAVYVATPIGVHSHWAMAAARAGKHVLCEKTLARNVAETVGIIATCDDHDVALLEGFAYQFHPQHQEVRQIVHDGRIGEPVLFQGWFGFPPIKSAHRYDPELGGGSLLDAGTYPVHAARRFFEREPELVHAALDVGGHPVDIHGSALLDFGNGQTALIAFGFENLYRSAYAVWGTTGQVTLTRAYAIPPTFSPSVTLERQSHRETWELAPFDVFAAEIATFCAGIDDPDERRSWRDDALGQARALELIREAAGSATR